MRHIVRLRIDQLRLDHAAAGLTSDLPQDLTEALRLALTAKQNATTPDWPITTRPALRQATDHLAAQVALPVREDGE